MRTGYSHPKHSLLVAQCNFDIIELGVLEFLAHVLKGMLELVFEVLRIGPTISWGSGRHCAVKIKRG